MASRDTMRRYLVNAAEYLPSVKATTRENGLPDDIAYLVMLESGANPEARSPANALGMWQFMSATGRSYGLRVDSWVDERLRSAEVDQGGHVVSEGPVRHVRLLAAGAERLQLGRE